MTPHGVDLRKNLRIGTGEGLLATPWVFMAVPGNLILAALLTQYFKIDKVAYGAIASLPAWCNALQIFLVPYLARFLSPKDLTLGIGWLNIGLWTMFAAVLGYLPVDDPRQITILFYIFFALASLSQSFIGVGWTSWVRDWVPAAVRGLYFGRRNRLISLITVAYLLLASVVFRLAPGELWPYQVLIGSAVLLRYGSLIWQYGIRTKSDHAQLSSGNWWGRVRETLRSPELLLFIVFSAWINFWFGFAGPFIPVYALEQLHVSPGTFTILVVIGSLSGMLGFAWWGKLIDRHGAVPVLVTGLLIWEIQQYLWAVVSPETTWMLYLMWIWGGFFGIAYFQGSFNLLLKLIPQNARLAGTSLFVAITSIAAAIAPIIAGALLIRFLDATGDSLTVYRVGFAIKSTAVLLGLLAFRGFREPARTTRTSLPGAFRTLRQLLSGLGPGFLSNFSPPSKRKK